MNSFLSGIQSTFTGLRPLLLAAGAAAGTCYLMSKLRNENKMAEASTQTQLEKPRWKKLYFKGPLMANDSDSLFEGIRRADGLQVAIKFIIKDKDMKMIETSQGVLPRELALMLMANTTHCSNVLRLLEWFDEPSYYVMIMEWPKPCQDLFDFCGEHGDVLNESLAKKVTAQVIKALLHCKNCGVFHRDVRVENLLVQTDTEEVKLFGFGCGDVLRSTPYKKYEGTNELIPPEWVLQKKYLAEPATVWSVGIMLHEIVCGYVPFKSKIQIIDGYVEYPEFLSPECRHLISWCLEPNAADRPTLEQLELHHWLQ